MISEEEIKALRKQGNDEWFEHQKEHGMQGAGYPGDWIHRAIAKAAYLKGLDDAAKELCVQCQKSLPRREDLRSGSIWHRWEDGDEFRCDAEEIRALIDEANAS